MGDATDSVIMPRVLQGRGSVVTDLVDVSAVNLGLSVNDMLVSIVQVLLSVSKAERTTIKSLVSNCKAIRHLKSTTESGKGGYKVR